MQALQEAAALGVDRLPSEQSLLAPVTEDELDRLHQVVHGAVRSELLNVFPGYRGIICQSLGLFVMDRLVDAGFRAADLVIGEVRIQGNCEYDTALKDLKRDWHAGPAGAGNQSLHVWVTIGDDVVVDAGIGARLARYYRAPEYFADEVVVGRASELASGIHCVYEPMLFGRAFVERTNRAAFPRPR